MDNSIHKTVFLGNAVDMFEFYLCHRARFRDVP
jgi:hypothetical protein